MLIEKIHINSFCRLENRDFDFSDGINIISGENESGKSSLANFIRFIFFGFPQRSEEKQLYINWNTYSASGFLILLHTDGKRYKIERSITQISSSDKISYRESCNIIDMQTNSFCFKNQSPADIFLGEGVTERVFSSTIYTGQISDKSVSGDGLMQAAQNILFSGDEKLNTQKAIDKLDKTRASLYHKNHKGGKIFDAENAKRELEIRLASAMEASTDIIACENISAEATEEKHNNDKNLEKYENDIKLATAYKVKKASEQLQKEQATLDGYKKQMIFFNDTVSRENIEDMINIKNEIDRVGEKIAATQAEIMENESKMGSNFSSTAVFSAKAEKYGDMNALRATVKSSQKAIKACGIFSIISLILAIAAVVFGVIAANFIGYILGGALLLAFGILFFIRNGASSALSVILRDFGVKNTAELLNLIDSSAPSDELSAYIKNNIQKSKSLLETYNSKLAALYEKARFILDKAGFSATDDNIGYQLIRAKEECQKLLDKRQDLEQKILIAAKACENTAKSLEGYTAEDIEIARGIPFDEQAMEAFNFRKKEYELNILRDKGKSLNEKILNTQTRLAELKARAEDPSALSVEYQQLTAKIEEMKINHSALELAVHMLESAKKLLLESISPEISQNAGSVIAVLTNGKYTSIGIDDQFNLSYNDSSVTRSAAYLSCGAADTAYISLRLSLMHLLFREKNPPIIFDESFAYLDESRLYNVLNMLSKVFANNHQILIFTCHSRENSIMQGIGKFNQINI